MVLQLCGVKTPCEKPCWRLSRAPGVPSRICQNPGPGPRAGECGGSIRNPHCFASPRDGRSRLDGQTSALRTAKPTRKQHRGVEPDRCAVSASPRTHMAIFCSEHSQPCEALFSDPFFAGGRPGPLGAPEPLSPRPCPLRCDGAFPEGARLACVASSPPQRPYLVCFRAPLVRWYSGHLTSRNFT